MMNFQMFLGALLAVSTHSMRPYTDCRCLPGDACWEAVDWNALNASVEGRLEVSVDELKSCVHDLQGKECDAALEGTDDEYWLTARPNGYLHTGIFGHWNMSNRLSSYAVRAKTEADFEYTVAFASKNNLRLVVKATGHDWYGRSTAAGSLLLWTHQRKDIAWHDAYKPAGSTEPGVPAVTVQSGVQFSDLYPLAQTTPYPNDPLKRKTIVMGGGCDSVGVGGCWLGGCYNVFTRKFGDGAVNMLEAKVVLANGTLITTSETSHPQVFWTLRGGGGGNTGVVTEFTARTHPAPRYLISSEFRGVAKDIAGFKVLLKRVLQFGSSEVIGWPLDLQCTSGSPVWNMTAFEVQYTCRHYEGHADNITALYQPLVEWCRNARQQGSHHQHPDGSSDAFECSSFASVTWKQTEYNATAHMWDKKSAPVWIGNEPWLSFHPDREISTALIGSLGKYVPVQAAKDENAINAIVDGIVKIEVILSNMSRINGGVHVLDGPTGDKSQVGMPPEIAARFAKTAVNPVLLNTAFFWLIMINIPSLPQLPPSSRLLKSLWPRLQTYAILSKQDPLWSTCNAGAGGDSNGSVDANGGGRVSDGDEKKAKECFSVWNARIPALRAQVDEIRTILWDVFPNEDKNGVPYSGSYWNEGDYEDPDFGASFWGTNYPRLLELKKELDPHGLFYGHNAVGSELWDQSGNCRVVNSTNTITDTATNAADNSANNAAGTTLEAAKPPAAAAISQTVQTTPSVNITWAEFTDAFCTVPLGPKAGGITPLMQCGVVPGADPNPMWRQSSFQFMHCSEPAGEPATAFYRAFSDGSCTKPFVNWTLSVKAMDCVLVPAGPNASAHRGPPIWHSVVGINCVN